MIKISEYFSLDSAGKYSSISEKLPCLLSTENQDDLYYIIQQQYGGVWGTFNFEDSFGDCSGEVNLNFKFYILCYHFLFEFFCLNIF